ncbi:hypothetical protein GCM10009839_07510 [Catenulispora yoronensis]|uniref:Ricin B lectin domain-containing protein n=1 Tax=Catenulispora yoronensis TaxID=450799 RepID=A0ABP5F2X5_9ACTN
MRNENRRRHRLIRLGLFSAFASFLAVVLTGAPANAASSGAGLLKASRTVAAPGGIGNPVYNFVNVNSGLCLAYDPESRGAARQEACNNDNTVNWVAASNGAGQYELIDTHNNQCLSVSGGSSADGAAEFVYNCMNIPDQLYTLVPEFSIYPGAYELVNQQSGKCVAVGGGRTNLGAWVIQWTCNPSAEFMWRPIGG